MGVEQAADRNKLIVDIDFVNKGYITDMKSLLEVLPKYASCISNVEVRIFAPARHITRAMHQNRVEGMKNLAKVLDTFKLEKLHVIIGLDGKEFLQKKLAAFFYMLKFEKRTGMPNLYSWWQCRGQG